MWSRIAVVVGIGSLVGFASLASAQQTVDVASRSGTMNPGQQVDLEFKTLTDQAGTIQSHQHEFTVTYSPPDQWVFGLLQFWRPFTNPPSWWTMLRGYGVNGELRSTFGAPAYRSDRRWRFRIRHEDNIDGDDATAVQFDVKVRRAKGGAWAHSGQGATVFDKPLSITRVRIRSSFSGTSENFIVWCRSPSEDLIVNELVGSTWDNDGTEGVYRMADCREVEVNTGSGVSWQFSQEGGATAFAPARSWAHTTGAGDELSTEALTDLATASDLERAWPRR